MEKVDTKAIGRRTSKIKFGRNAEVKRERERENELRFERNC